MTWFKVDDNFPFHPKVIAAGNSALGLWVRAGAWCSAHLTDGALPQHMVSTLGAQARDARRLCEVGLWVETAEGYSFHGWASMQPSKAQIEAEREAGRERQKAFRERVRNGVTNKGSNGKTSPAPTRPDPLKEKTSSSTAAPSKDFNEFWLSYPRKVGKQAADRAYRKALKLTTPQQILAGVQSLRREVEGKDPKFTPHPATWLNEGRWDDEPSIEEPLIPHYWRQVVPGE